MIGSVRLTELHYRRLLGEGRREPTLRKERVTANDALAESDRGQRYALLELLTVDLAYRKRPNDNEALVGQRLC